MMIKPQKLLITLLFIVNINTTIFSQSYRNDTSLCSNEYYQYLLRDLRYTEIESWLKECLAHNNDKNLLAVKLSELYLLTGEFDSANKYFKNIYRIEDSILIEKAIAVAFITRDTDVVYKYIKDYEDRFNETQILEYNACYAILTSKIIDDTTDLSKSELSELFFRYNYFNQKKVVLSGILSSIIPGIGKLYLGYPKQARSSFIVNTILLALTIELALQGFLIPAITAGIITSVFYSGNIVGTVNLAKKRKLDYYKQIDEDLCDYYIKCIQ